VHQIEKVFILANFLLLDARTSSEPLLFFARMSFKCRFCDSEFNSSKLLQAHICRHTRLYYCKACGASFPHRFGLFKHLKSAGHYLQPGDARHRIAPSVRVPFKTVKGTKSAAPAAYRDARLSQLGKPMFNDLQNIPNPIFIGERVVDFSKSINHKKPVSAVGRPVPSGSQESPARPRKQPHEPLEPYTIPKKQRRRNRKDFDDKVKRSQRPNPSASCAMEVDEPPPVDDLMDIHIPNIRFNPEPPALLIPELPPPPPTSPAAELAASLLDLEIDMPPIDGIIDLNEPLPDWLLDSDNESRDSDDRPRE